MFRLGQKVVIVEDKFEQNLPVGSYGYIIAVDKNPDNAFDFVLRIPKSGKHIYVPACDIEAEEILLRREAEKVEREALIDFALATKNEELFKKVMNGDLIDTSKESKENNLSQDDFLKQVHLKAWI
ncbi:ATPase [Chengkuizengella axinellae]|uniref:ATPase n=1 Tax=Chengkuizengella axinellae TaxID=3064388 RepID=A0ABT9J5V1_9BACL|nr:ATPase [Chengkuizengella sp. 2205SS18-9]MDP5276998.1 ATPase [Chengkuizengella sp. 2205SS18-9]